MNDRQPVCEWFFIDKTLLLNCVFSPNYGTFTNLWYIFTEISALINIEKKDN